MPLPKNHLRNLFRPMKIFGASLCAVAFLFGCASQRQKPVCAEIEYRLNHTAMSPDRRGMDRGELSDCRAEQAEYEKSDSLTNRIKKGIYEMMRTPKRILPGRIPCGSLHEPGKSQERNSASPDANRGAYPCQRAERAFSSEALSAMRCSGRLLGISTWRFTTSDRTLC